MWRDNKHCPEVSVCPAGEKQWDGSATFFLLCFECYINWFCLEMFKGICTKSRLKESGEQGENSFGEQWAAWICRWETPEGAFCWSVLVGTSVVLLFSPWWGWLGWSRLHPKVLHKHKTHCRIQKSCFVYGCSPLVLGVLIGVFVCFLFLFQWSFSFGGFTLSSW